MSARDAHASALRAIPLREWEAYLTAHSGLPGPRGNLELADAFTQVADADTIRRLADSEDEYLRFCGTQALGRLLVASPASEGLLALLRERATDDRWRVREAAARALQIVGDSDAGQLRRIVTDWAEDPRPLVRRAALAAICEPRLLTDPASTELALRLCARETRSIADLAAPVRREPDVRTLRQALGYCWSVAIAADPGAGLPLFEELRSSIDPDVEWIVRTNLSKTRLRRLLPS